MNILIDGDVTTVGSLATSPIHLKGSNTAPKRIPTLPDGRPYFPGSGFRGRLRRMARDEVQAAHEELDPAFRLDQDEWFWLTLGGIKQGGVDNLVDYRRIGKVAAHPLYALFGGSTPWIAGKVSVGHILPPKGDDNKDMNGADMKITVSGARHNDWRRDPSLWAHIEGHDEIVAQFVERLLMDTDLQQMKRERDSLEAILNRLPRGAEETEEIQGQRERYNELCELVGTKKPKSGKGKPGAAVAIQQPLVGYEAIKPGLVMPHRITIHRATDTEMGLLMAALRRFSENPRLGAHAHQGSGEVSCDYSVYAIADGRKENIGSIKIGLDQDDPFYAEGRAAEWLRLWDTDRHRLAESGFLRMPAEARRASATSLATKSGEEDA